MSEALSADEIDRLLAGADKAAAAIKEGREVFNSYETEINFEYGAGELEKIKNLLVGLGGILPEIITDEFLDEVAGKWVKKYLKIHLGGMTKSEIKPKKYRTKSAPKVSVYIEAMEINESTEAEVVRWAGRGVIIRSPVLEPTEDNPSGVYWQVKNAGLEYVCPCIPGDFIFRSIDGLFTPCPRKKFLEYYEPVGE